jgi:hypothetical protein
MNGISTNLPLGRVMGQECVQISIWQLQLQFDFSDGGSIIVESKWELWNGCNVIDQSMSHAQRETYSLQSGRTPAAILLAKAGGRL